MDRLLPVLRSFLARIQPLWRIEQAGGGQATIHLRSPLALAAWALLLAWYIARPSPPAALATAGLGGLLSGAYLWARGMAAGLSARRRLLYAAVQVGDEIEEIVQLSNTSLLPALWVEFHDQSNIPGYNLTSVRAAEGRSQLEWRVHAVCTLRGNYHFGPWEMLSGDPFGLFRVTLAYPQREDLLVYPPLAALPEEVIQRGRVQGDDRPLPQALQAESLSAFSTRPYAPGDPLRRIHWPTTARQAAPYVKLFDPEASSTLWLIPDLDHAVQVGEGPDSTLETSVTLLASLAHRLLDERLAVGLIAYAQTPAVVPPARGKPHLWQLLRVLAGLQPGPQPLAETLARARALVSGRDRVLVVTPSLSPAWAGELHRLGGPSRRAPAEILLLDPASFAQRAYPSFGGSPTSPAGTTGVDTGITGVNGMLSFLASLGFTAHVLRRGDIRPYSGSYGELNRWEFQTLGTGRAIVRRRPRARPPGPETHRG